MNYTRSQCISDVALATVHVANGRKDLAKQLILDVNQKIKGLFHTKIKHYIEGKYESRDLEDPRSTFEKLMRKERNDSSEHFNTKTLTPLLVKDTFRWARANHIKAIGLAAFTYYAPISTGIVLSVYGFYKLFD